MPARGSGARDTRLSRALSALYDRTPHTQTEVVAAVRNRGGSLSQAELSRILNGRSIPSEELLEHLFEGLDADEAERAQIREIADAARPGIEPARLVIERGFAHLQTRIHDIEQQAEMVRAYQPGTILGQLQTEAFAQAVWDSGHPDAVTERLARQRSLLEDDNCRWVLIHTEGALRFNFAGAAVMAEQCEHLARLAREHDDRICIGVIPAMARTGVQAFHGFTIYDFPDRRGRRDPRMVQIGTLSGMALLKEAEAERYMTAFERLEQAAVFGSHGAAVMERIADDYRRAE